MNITFEEIVHMLQVLFSKSDNFTITLIQIGSYTIFLDKLRKAKTANEFY